MISVRSTLLCALVVATASATSAFAREAVHGYLAAGAATLPEYEGADAQQVIPFAAGRVQQGARYLALEGVSARANLAQSASWEIGPVAAITFGRDEDVESPAAARLPKLDDAVELGGFLAHAWAGLARDGDALRLEARALADVSDVHNGWQATLSAGYATPLGAKWRIGAEVSATLVSDDYAEAYFSIAPADAAASGLPAFDANGGVKDAGLALNASFALSERWSLTGFASYRRLLADAADSPIVAVAGSPDQFSGGLGVGYAF